MVHPPGDGRRGVNPMHRPANPALGQRLEPCRQQRIMRAGERNRIGLVAMVIDKTWCDFSDNRLVRHLFALHIGFGQTGEIFGPDKVHFAMSSKAAHQIMRV